MTDLLLARCMRYNIETPAFESGWLGDTHSDISTQVEQRILYLYQCWGWGEALADVAQHPL
ncbi:hypothetical protein N7454_007430 [Penicillium verhagenii]|nr:hypothetical protein N7454_007430 [Penicillium verhagenii]